MKRLILNDVGPNFVKYSNEKKSVILTAHPDELIERNLITYFEREEREKIRKASSLYYIDNGRFIFWFGVLLAVYTAILISTIPLNLAGRNFEILGTHQSLGAIIFHFTFVVLDSLSATLGYRYAKATVFIGVATEVFIAIMLIVTVAIFNVGKYEPLFNNSIHMLIMGSISLIAGDQTNNIIFRYFKLKLVNSPLWMRCMISTSFGSIITTFIFVMSTDTSMDVLQKTFDSYGIRIVSSLILIPFTYFLVGFYKRYILGHKKNELELEKKLSKA